MCLLFCHLDAVTEPGAVFKSVFCASRMKFRPTLSSPPLPDPVYEMLCEEREKQDLYRRMFKGGYNRIFDNYICVDLLG